MRLLLLLNQVYYLFEILGRDTLFACKKLYYLPVISSKEVSYDVLERGGGVLLLGYFDPVQHGLSAFFGLDVFFGVQVLYNACQGGVGGLGFGHLVQYLPYGCSIP